MIIKQTKNPKDIEAFLARAGNSLTSFRYFKTRPITVISNHVITILGYENDEPIAYGHLDKEGENIWLGICIQEAKKSNGHGTEIMHFLINTANDMCLNLKLTVDSANIAGIRLYEKFGFTKQKEFGQSFFYERKYNLA